MFAQVSTVAFEGIDAQQVDVQVLIAPGLPAFSIVGLPDKSVGESRERVRAALTAIGLEYGPAFQGVESVWTGVGSICGC